MKRLGILLLIVCGCSACFTIWDKPAPTEAGWKLFGYADEAFGAHRRAVMRAVHLDEYRRQTTDEGRLEVQERYFPRERIVGDGAVWRIVSTEYVWTFEISGGLPLAEPGAEWHIIFKADHSDHEKTLSIRTGDDGTLSVESRIDLPRFATSAETEARVTEHAEEPSLAFTSGGGTLRGLDVPRLDVSYTISRPVVLTGAVDVPESGGALAIRAYNPADSAEEEVAARYLDDGQVEIDYLGQTDIWRQLVSDYPSYGGGWHQ